MTAPSKPPASWPIAVVAAAFLAALVVVAIFAQSQTTVIVMVGLAIMGGLGLNLARTTEAKQEASAAKDQSNGNMTRMLTMVEKMAGQLAEMQPIPPDGSDDSKS